MMKDKITKSVIFVLIFQLSFLIVSPVIQAKNRKKPRVAALIITGQNNHYWKNSTPIFKRILEDAEIFRVNIAQSPAQVEDMSVFNPVFSDYDVVVLDYNGDSWNEATKRNFEEFVRKGGGVVVIHAADNSFPEWGAYNKIIGLGGWGNRDEKSGPYVYWKDNQIVKDYSPGSAGGHGPQWEYNVDTEAPKHPIMKGFPSSWKHAKDELYHKLRGPAENMKILATSYSDKNKDGTGRNEPILFTVRYGKGRIFHTVMGHVGKNETVAVQCAGFVYSLQRGTEWAATGKVKQKLPKDMLSPNRVHLMPQYNITGN